MKRLLIALIAPVLLLGFAGCAQSTADAATKPIVESPWVRSTDDAKDATMSAAFLSIVNPGNTDIRLIKASTDVAGMVQLHEMVMADGKKVMQEVKGGIVIPAGGHKHLVSGGDHIMLMKLKQALKIGDKVTLQLTFDNGATLSVDAPVKAFVEEEDHYHSPTPTPSG